MNTIITSNALSVETLIQFCLKELGIDGITVTVCRNKKMLERLAPPDIELDAMIYPTSVRDAYNILLRGDKPSNIVICHEMIHLSQMVSGKLIPNIDTGKVIWRGKEYDNSTPYFEREWEVEAFDRQTELLKAYRKELRNNKHGIL